MICCVAMFFLAVFDEVWFLATGPMVTVCSASFHLLSFCSVPRFDWAWSVPLSDGQIFMGAHPDLPGSG